MAPILAIPRCDFFIHQRVELLATSRHIDVSIRGNLPYRRLKLSYRIVMAPKTRKHGGLADNSHPS